jgi:ribokinase
VKPDIVVIGSVNHDLTVVTTRFPLPGESVLGTDHYSGGGGKGANQAVAAGRLGAKVAIVSRVGDDEHGRSLVEALATENIDVSAIGVDSDAPTGLAVITVDQHAENMIVVSPGANMGLLPTHLDADLIADVPVVLTQLEIPVEAVTAAARLTTGTFIVNPAPGRPLPVELLNRVDVLVPNRSELGLLAGTERPDTTADVVQAARSIGTNAAVVVTLGADGALLVTKDQVQAFPSPDVSPVDPTGAGDAFCAAVAHGLAVGMELSRAIERAVVAGALATTRQGAQAGMPTNEEVEAVLGH